MIFSYVTKVTPPLDVETLSQTLKEKNILPSTLKFGFLGLGIMGSGIVKNLINSGHSVIVWNRTQEKVCSEQNSIEKIFPKNCDGSSFGLISFFQFKLFFIQILQGIIVFSRNYWKPMFFSSNYNGLWFGDSNNFQKYHGKAISDFSNCSKLHFDKFQQFFNFFKLQRFVVWRFE